MQPVEFTPVSVVHEDVPTYLAERIARKLVVVNKRLAKIGAPAATVTYGPRYVHTWRDEDTGIERSVERFETVAVNGFEVRLAGWHPVASLDHTLTEDEALVAKFPSQYETEVPAEFRFRGPVCDHCGHSRLRNTTILFAHEDGRWTQVGTSCVLEYLGVDPSVVLWLAQGAVSLPDDEEGGGFVRYFVSPLEFLSVAAELTRGAGFVPSSEPGCNRDLAASIAYGTIKQAEFRKLLPDFDIARGEAEAELITAWVTAQPANSDFMQSAQLAVRATKATERTYGILAALPHIHAKALADKVLREAEQASAPSEFVGKVGDKITVTGTLAVCRTFDTAYGVSRMIVVVAATGERVLTFGSGNTLFGRDVHEGATVTLSGKVKAHETDERFGKTTKVSHAKLAVLAEAAA